MTDEQFEQLMRDAEQTYRPPPTPDFDAMWKTVASRVAEETSHTNDGRGTARAKRAMWFRIAATLVVGIGLGRASVMVGHGQTAVAPAAAPNVSATRVARDTAMARPYEVETSQYLGQTAALLVSLPSEVKAGRADQQFTARAGDLLMRTRLLMDSPAADDPAMRSLFDDLELVLAQVVRLQNNSNRLELDLINRALEQRDVIPRLRTAAADISAN